MSVVLQDVCNNNASFDLSGEQTLNAIAEMEEAHKLVKVRMVWSEWIFSYSFFGSILDVRKATVGHPSQIGTGLGAICID